jgi:dipeptidyl aminopeptidase/acylaminoacyl peptidase
MVFRKLATTCVTLCWMVGASAQVDVEQYIKPDAYDRVKISPTGEYFALTVNLPDRQVLVIQRRSDGKLTGKAAGTEHSAVADFWWVNDHRVIVAMAAKLGSRDAPEQTGELHGLNADGSNAKLLIGASNLDRSSSAAVYDFTGSTLQFAELIDTLPKDPQKVLVSISNYAVEPTTRVARMDVDTGRTNDVATAPLKRASFASDSAGVVRFAEGKDRENYSRLLYRDSNDADWRVINDERSSGLVESPLGFSADAKTAYLRVQRKSGPDAIVSLEPTTGKRVELLRDKRVDPDFLIYAPNGLAPVGANFTADRRHNAFFDETGADAALYRKLEAAFPGHSVLVTSTTDDGKLALLLVSSDTNPGDFYLYDTSDQRATGVFSRRLWLDPEKMAPTRSVEFAARDGLLLHGFVTLPKGAAGGLPMIVLPHGGPFGVADTWDFDEEVQLLTDAGYAVMRVNFRGSGNYGRAFMHAGAKEWGGLMQDDVTDATRWAITQGIADPKRICIYGASYGAYAAMMALAREPALYRCGVGYVGVYDLPLMYRADAGRATFLKNWLNDWLGPESSLAAISPTQHAVKITQPVFLAAGGKDWRAPIAQSERMGKALKAVGNAPETLYFATEGHGFYTEAHRREFYTKLLEFLSRSIGGAKAKSALP